MLLQAGRSSQSGRGSSEGMHEMNDITLITQVFWRVHANHFWQW